MLSFIRTLPTLTHVRDIEGFEGPLLSLFRDKRGTPYIYYWCDRDEKLNRWLVFRTTESLVTQYETKEITLKELIMSCCDRFVYVCDIDSDGEQHVLGNLVIKDIPEDYLPAGDVYFSA